VGPGDHSGWLTRVWFAFDASRLGSICARVRVYFHDINSRRSSTYQTEAAVKNKREPAGPSIRRPRVSGIVGRHENHPWLISPRDFSPLAFRFRESTRQFDSELSPALDLPDSDFVLATCRPQLLLTRRCSSGTRAEQISFETTSWYVIPARTDARSDVPDSRPLILSGAIMRE
jgi:hypothetical protein